ncbi:MAG: hypothetical protein WC663_00245 [Patescibacteria group bacterium]|jgi:hypothetical protein
MRRTLVFVLCLISSACVYVPGPGPYPYSNQSTGNNLDDSSDSYQDLNDVPEIPVPGLPDIAISSLQPNGQPVIYFNPMLVAQAGPYITKYTKMHEYGHIMLGHLQKQYYERYFMTNPYSQMWTNHTRELEADCWATEHLTEDPAAIRSAINLFQSQGMFQASPNHPPGIARAQKIMECSKE